jgi:DNA-binding MarR family transcriptional regulator
VTSSADFFDSMSAVIRRFRANASERYAVLGIGTAQAKMLRHIGQNARISQADLSRATDTAPALTGRAVEPLIERGWIRRRKSEEDRRQYTLELTAAGERMRERIEAERAALIAEIGTTLDERDLKDFARIAKKLLAAFPT